MKITPLLLLCSSLALIHSGIADPEIVPFPVAPELAPDSVANISSWNEKVAGEHGWILPGPNGSLQLDGKPFRLWGVNMAGKEAFLTRDKAELTAKRLAAAGFNSVRLHHLDNHWGEASLIAYSREGSRSLNTDRLSELVHLISALKHEGIYVDLNLLVSRQFMAVDGFTPEMDKTDWKQSHMPGFWNSHHLDLQKEYARKLLSSYLPGGKKLVDDPVIAVIEINNENGLMHSWIDGSLDRLSDSLKKDLKQQWNDWLKKKYSSSVALRKAWGTAAGISEENLLRNASLADGLNEWVVEQHEDAKAQAVVEKLPNGDNTIKLNVLQKDKEGWHVQLDQVDLPLQPENVYTISFRARAHKPRGISVSVMDAGDPYSSRGLNQNIGLTEEWQKFSFAFTCEKAPGQLRLCFSRLAESEGEVYLSNLRLSKGAKQAIIGDIDNVLETDNVQLLIRNGENAFVPEQAKADWYEFLYGLEVKYFDSMRDFIKKDLGYKGLVIGTCTGYSTPTIQARLDAVDTHAYWTHPHFPGRAWDPTNWSMETDTAINHPGAPLESILSSHVAGKPFFITEYQHAFPNPHTGEGPLLISSYAAFQNDDAIYLFDYDQMHGSLNNYFNVSDNPMEMANATIAAALFRRGDVPPASTFNTFPLDEKAEIAFLPRHSFWSMAGDTLTGIPSWIGITQGYRLSTTSTENPDTARNKIFSPFVKEGKFNQPNIYTTPNIQWDMHTKEKGLLTVSTPRSIALAGTIPPDLSVGPVHITCSGEKSWATMGLTLMQTDGDLGKPAHGAKCLLVYAGELSNSGMAWNKEHNSVGTQWGKGPPIAEIPPISLTVPFPAKVWSLDNSGRRRQELPTQKKDNGTLFDLDGKSGTIWYELEVQ